MIKKTKFLMGLLDFMFNVKVTSKMLQGYYKVTALTKVMLI